MCGNPVCRRVLTLDVHHMERVADKGSDSAEDFLPLCPNCHALHHQGEIPVASIRTWKMLALALNEAFDRRSVDMLLALHKLEQIWRLTGDGALQLAPLVAAGLVHVRRYPEGRIGGRLPVSEMMYLAELTAKGKLFVDAWRKGDQSAAVVLSPRPAV